jgi:hypothetical protein
MPYLIPQAGKPLSAKITRIEQRTAGEVFKSKTGKFNAKFSKPTDEVYVIYGKIEGEIQEHRLGTVNVPHSKILYGKSKLCQLLIKAGFDLSKTTTVSDDLHELKGRTIKVTVNENGYARL